MLVLRLLILLLGVLFASPATALFSHARFQSSRLYDVPVRLDKVDGVVAAFADFNSDKFTDLLVLTSDLRSIEVYLWDHAKWEFVKSNAVITVKDFYITNILPGDFNYDGNLDVLVMGQADPNKIDADEIFMRLYHGNGEDFDEKYVEIPSAKPPQPMPLDFGGNMKTDLLGYAHSDDGDQLHLWKNVYKEENGTLFEIVPFPVKDSDVEPCKLANPHSNAFIDLNGDCLSDLFLTCEEDGGQKSFEIWTNAKEDGFVFNRTAGLPKGTGQISFADIDGDGTIDMVFPVCDGSECAIHVAYNRQMPLCAHKQDTTSNCRQAANLCRADPNFEFNLREDDDDNDAYVIIPASQVKISGGIVMNDLEFKGTMPVSIQVGDYNLDGYPDLLVISKSDSGSQVSLLQSVPCTLENCAYNVAQAQRRFFVKVEDGADDLNSIDKATSAAFFDLDEDGTLDMLVFEATGEDTVRKVHAIQNNYFNDAFFVKTMVLNGVGKKQNFGVNYPGAAFKFTVLDTSGKKRANQVAQYPQAAYFALQTPYCLFGLGRTNNYVEELFVGTTRNQSAHYTTFSGVIPNSQLIIVPYQPKDVHNPSTWSLELYIHPGDWIPWVLLALVSATVILAFVVFALNWAEKREDEMEKKRALHDINFDAL